MLKPKKKVKKVKVNKRTGKVTVGKNSLKYVTKIYKK